MSCFPCFGGGKGKNNDDADPDTPVAAASNNMTPPPMMHAPAAYSSAPVAVSAAMSAHKPGGGERAPTCLSFDRFIDNFGSSRCMFVAILTPKLNRLFFFSRRREQRGLRR